MTREVVVNGRFLSRRVTGVERHGREIVRLFRDNYRLEETRVNGLAGHAWEQVMLPTRLKSGSILWSPANTGPLMVRGQALTIHDLSPLEHPEWFKKSFAAWYRLFLPILARRVRVIFTPSEYVKQKVAKRFGVTNVIVAPNGVDTSRFHPGAKQDTHSFPEKYVLFVGSLQPRKNLHSLWKTWRTIKDENPDVWLVVAGEAGSVFGRIKLQPEERLHFPGYITEDDLPGLYSRATLFVLPSFDEGFGLSALEAMACGTPVIVSDGGALPEVVGDAARVFSLSDPDGLPTAMHECLTDKELRCSLKQKGLARAKGFPWQRSAELVWNTLHEI
jgi:glycosyltransferase involved in cell wall biosynthesis